MLNLIKKASKQPGKPNRRNPIAILFLIAIVISYLSYMYFAAGPREKVNDKSGINQVVAQYLSGAYAEIVVEGETLSAKKPVRQEMIAGKLISIIDVDKILMPPKDSLKDLGFNNPSVATKISVKDDIWGKFLVDLLPTLL